MPAADAYVTDGVDGALGVLEDMTGLKRTVFDDVSELQADFQKLMESETIDLDEYLPLCGAEMARSHALGK